MKKNNIGLDIFLIVLLYFVIQTFCSFAIVGIDLAINFDQLKEFMQGEGNKNDIMAFARQQLDSLLGIILVVASVLTILVIALLKKSTFVMSFPSMTASGSTHRTYSLPSSSVRSHATYSRKTSIFQISFRTSSST